MTHWRKRHKVRDRNTGYARFKSRELYDKYGLYPNHLQIALLANGLIYIIVMSNIYQYNFFVSKIEFQGNTIRNIDRNRM